MPCPSPGPPYRRPIDFAESVAGWERIDARFERACTLVMLDARSDEGHRELAALSVNNGMH